MSLQRLSGHDLAALEAKETEIEASFRGAISTAKQQKATSLLARRQLTQNTVAKKQKR
jgi:hypothetical protein